jgi:hypothetical protein
VSNDIKVTPNSIKEMLDTVQADRNAKQVFLKMPREEQLLAILGMITFLTSQIANLQKENIQYRQERELREKQLVELLDTDPGIKALSPDEKQNTVQKIFALATRPARGGGLLDKVLSLILVILFYLFMTGKIP